MRPVGIVASSVTPAVEPTDGLQFLNSWSGQSASSSLALTVDLGTPASDRTVLVLLAYSRSVYRHPSGTFRLAGVDLIKDAWLADNTRTGFAIGRATIPTGTTGPLEVSWNSSGGRYLIATYSAPAALQLVASATTRDVSGQALSVTLPESGLVVVGGGAAQAVSRSSLSGLTLDAERTDEPCWLGHQVTSGAAHTVTAGLSGVPSSTDRAALAACAYA